MSESEDDGIAGTREVAYRLFATEFDQADLSYSESDEERAPNYVVTPTGGRVNRLFVVGVLTEVESVSEDVLRARVVDPTGAFVLYAGQYQPDEQAFLERADPPMFVAVTGKARTFQPDDSDQVFTSVRPESISEVDAETRDRWTVQAAEQTIDRVEACATALALGASGDRLQAALVERGIEEGLAEGIDLAIDHYGTTPSYLAGVRQLAVDAAGLVAGEIDEVPALSVQPNAAGDVTATDLLAEPVDPLPEPDEAMAPSEAQSGTDRSEATTTEGQAGAQPETGTEPDAVEETAAATGTATEPDSDLGSDTAEDAEETGAGTGTPGDEGATAPQGDAEAEGADLQASDSEPAEPATADTDAEPAAEQTVDSPDPTGDDEPAADAEPAAEAEPSDEDAEADLDTDGPGDFEAGEFDLDDEEREEIEEEYGTEFQSGSEVEDPGEAGIETPDEEPGAAESEEEEAAPAAEAESPETAAADEPADDGTDGDVDIEDAVMDAMADLDDGDGAERSAVVDAVVERTGADAGAVEDGIQDALMDGRCYEPDEDTLKPI